MAKIGERYKLIYINPDYPDRTGNIYMVTDLPDLHIDPGPAYKSVKNKWYLGINLDLNEDKCFIDVDDTSKWELVLEVIKTRFELILE